MKRKSHNEFVDEMACVNSNINIVGTYVNCSTKLEVQCAICCATWSATPNSLLRGSGCPRCANNQRKTQEKFVREMQEYNPYIQVIGTYCNAHTPLKVRCKICGYEWESKPFRLLRGAQCQNCIKPHTSFMEQFMLIAFQKVLGENAVESRNTDAIGTELDIYIPTYNLAIEPGTWLYHKRKAENLDLYKRQKCQEKCISLVTVYDTFPKDLKPPFEKNCYVFDGFLNEYGYQRLITLTQEIMSRFSIDHSHLDWKLIANQAYANCHFNANQVFLKQLAVVAPDIEVIEEFKGSHIPILVRSKKCDHPAWYARPETLLKGAGCPICGRQRAGNAHRRTHEEFVLEMRRVNPTIVIVGQYTKSTECIDVQCKICEKRWTPKAYSLLQGKGCPHCSAKAGAQNRSNSLRTKTHAQFISELQLIKPDIVVVDQYVNNKTPIRVKCNICHHIWKVVPASLLNGHGCPNCMRHQKDKK